MCTRLIRTLTTPESWQKFGNLRFPTSCGNLFRLNCKLDSTSIRSTSFFNKLPAEDLWRGVVSVSNAGKKRGRGKGSGRKVVKDLNRGQIIGLGKINMQWPGLNSPIIRGKELLQRQSLQEDPEREKNIIKLRDKVSGFRVGKVSPIDRGWSGLKMPGRSTGPPDPVGTETFDNFDTIVLENKIVFVMKGNMGRKRRYSVTSVTGNGNGLVGFSTSKAVDMRTALRKSKNRAGQKLMKIELCENRTVFHDFYTAFGKTKIFVSKKPENHGLVCHRAIQAICKVAGIKDLHAKIEGSTNLQHITKAFLIGLLQQKTYKQLANETNLHLVEFCDNQNGIAKVVASPEHVDNTKKINSFSQYVLDGRIILKKRKRPPFYVNSYGYYLYQKKQQFLRNQHEVRLNMLVHKGTLRSFLPTQKESSMETN